MTHKQIIVVNIDDHDNKNDEVIDTTEPVDKPIEIPQEVIEKIETVEETVEESQTPPVEDKPVEQVVEDKITRSQELIRCLKCNKMIKAKTLKYSHKNTCSGEEKTN